MKGILIFGASGHGKVVLDIARAADIPVLGFIDKTRSKGTMVCGVPVLGNQDDLPTIIQSTGCNQGVVAIGDNWVRSQIVQQILEAAPLFEFQSLIHPKATIGMDVFIGPGSVVMAGAVVNPCAQVGIHCILNTCVSVDHDCEIGNFASIAPRATLGGNVKIGDFSAIGLGVNIIHGRVVGTQTVVGAGSLVLHNIGDSLVAYGSPSRLVRERVAGDRYL